MNRVRQIITVFNELVERLAPLLLLNFAFFVTALPVITAGAAFAAVDEMCFELLEEGRYPALLSRYFQAFRRHFKHGTGVWMVFQFILVDVWLILWYYGGIRVLLHPVLSLALFLLALVFAFLHVWIFPLIAQREKGVLCSLKAAFFLSVTRYKKTLLCLLQSALLFVLTAICPLLLLTCFSSTAYLHCRILRADLRNYAEKGITAMVE